MSELARRRMTSDEFIAWAMEQPETEHYELIDGEVVAMAPENVGHARTKMHLCLRMTEAIEDGNLPCEVFPRGLVVEVDGRSVYEPDVVVHCGPRLPGDTIKLSDPVILVEVQSPSTSSRDAGPKLIDYFRLASLRHYLIGRFENRTVVHHERREDDTILTRIVCDGPIVIDRFPPGVA